jgi:predicted nucleotide-binding protein (sugar kinase/HSP70/actin superfamily)
MQQLLDQDLDRIFVPHVRNVAVHEGDDALCTCPLVQAEPYVLRSAFHDDLAGKLVTCVLDLDDPASVKDELTSVGHTLGVSRSKAALAFDRAWNSFNDHRSRMLEMGRQFVESREEDQAAIVLFGRPYNAFTSQANMGIPGKFTSRGHPVVPYDMMPRARPSFKRPGLFAAHPASSASSSRVSAAALTPSSSTGSVTSWGTNRTSSWSWTPTPPTRGSTPGWKPSWM